MLFKPEENGTVTAIWGLAVKKAKQVLQGLYLAYQFAFPDNQLGIFKVMLITITRSCVHCTVDNKSGAT